jgi:uncharacterized radical SAM superfamily Fe-S cluster-containing enzyme
MIEQPTGEGQQLSAHKGQGILVRQHLPQGEAQDLPREQHLHSTRALCPQCLRVLPAIISADSQGRVWMARTCPEHGEIRVMIWPDAEHYSWISSLAFPKAQPSGDALRPSAEPCPTGCGICQRHQRKPTLVEIEVTQRCNLRCPVCFMSAENDTSDVPLEKLRDFIEAIATTAGTDTGVQLTGGEPTVRPDLAQIVWFVRARGFWGVEVNTNGLVIAQDEDYLQDLKAHGLTGIYLQFDGLTSEVYREIRGADLLATKMMAIEHCRKQGVQVVLAMTIVSGINDDQIGAVLEFAIKNSDIIAGVALQPAFVSGRFDAKRVVPLTMGDVINMLEDQTGGLIKAEDIWPLGCSHPLCDTGTYLVRQGQDQGQGQGQDKSKAKGKGQCENQDFIPITRDLTREEYLELFDPDSPQGSVFLDVAARKGLSAEGGLSVIIMNYMDAWTADLERMEECSMFVTMPNGALIPFCSYQLTNCSGKRIYPPWNIPGAEAGIDWEKQ